MDTQQALIKELIDVMNQDYSPSIKFLEGYVVKLPDNAFKFVSDDPDSQFKVIEEYLVPTMFTDFNGKLEPNNDVYDESGTLAIQWSIPLQTTEADFYKNRYNDIRIFKRRIRALYGSFDIEDEDGVTTTHYYRVGSFPINHRDTITLDGKLVIRFEMSVPYRISTVPFNDVNEYRIREYVAEPNTGTWYSLAEIGRGMNLGISSQPYQAGTDQQAVSTPTVAPWRKDFTVYAINTPFITHLQDMFKTGTTSSTKVWELELTINSTDPVYREVFVTNLSYPDTKGTPQTYAFTFEIADDILKNKAIGG